ncbi:MAG: sigma 54-interacting transcriptional regulator [Candidatus Scalinduaceae bacterium]
MPERLTTIEGDIDEIIRFLKEASIFKGLSLGSLEKISEKIQMDSFTKDFPIIKRGSVGTRLYMIKSGGSRVVTGSEDEGEEFTVADIKSGECFGELSLLTGEPCCATVKTNEESLLYFITKSDFDNIISENPLIYKHFSKLLAERINDQNIKSTHLKEHEIALNRYLQKTKEYQYSHVIGRCRRMREVLQDVERFSKMDDPITIVGEPGTGKELIARKIHADSMRTKFPVIEIMIHNERRKTEIPVDNERRRRDQIECELFGNEKMVFLDGVGKRIGRCELVDKGTLIIKNIENMPLPAQKKTLKFIETGSFFRVGGDEPVYSDVRIVVTTKDIGLAQKQLDSKLFNLLCVHKLEVPPLSDCKKDIPYLMEHFAEKISKKKHVQTKKFSKEATNKLLKYDYPRNVDELEDVIERAVELTKENTIIEEEVIFLGDTDVEDKIRLNLLNIPLIKRLCESQRIFLAAKTTIIIFFILILYFGLVQPDLLIGGKSIVLILCWHLGIPLLFVTYLFAARFACGMCPMSSISKFLNRFVNLNLPIPSFIKKQGFLIMGIGFMSILFIEEYTHMTYSTTKTAYLILSVFFGTIIFDIIFEKSAWCRYLCPLGGMNGLFGMSSMVEIRANKNTCTTICTTHDCFNGTEKVGHCPMFLHLQFLSDNRDCKFCLNCIKSCKHNATRLNLRIPGAEIISLKQPSLTEALVSIALCGLLIAEIPAKLGISPVGFPFMFAISIFFALSLNFISNYFTASISKNTTIEHLQHFGYTLLPLALCGYIALKFVEVFGDASGSLMLFNIFEINLNFTKIIQLIMVVTGLFITEYLIYKVIQNKIGKEEQFRTFAIQGVVPLIFSILYISLFYKGMGFL